MAGFGFAGAMMGLGQGLQDWAKMKREEVAAEKKRAADMADAKELAKYKADLSKGSGGGGGKAPKPGLTSSEKDAVAAAFGYKDFKTMTEARGEGDTMAINALGYAEQIKAAAGGKISEGVLATTVRDAAVRGDKTEEGGWFSSDVVTPGAGEFTGEFKSPSATPSIKAPQMAIDALKKDPNLASQFDMKYGKGASAQYLQ